MKKMCKKVLPWSFAFLGFIGFSSADAAPELIYDGSSAPMAPAWSNAQQGTPTVVTSSGLTRFTTKTVIGSNTSDFNLYKYATGTNSFIASIRLKAYAVNNHNQLDAGLMFAVGDNFDTPFGNTTQRAAMLYIDTDAIGWADDSAPAVANDASQFHEYAIRYHNGQLDVFIDTTFDAIMAGTATPQLSRAMPPTGDTQGIIVFGDQTNDANVDSDFEVEFVKLQNLRLPTEPLQVQATTGDAQITASWAAPSYAGGSEITAYTATAFTTDTPPQTAGSCSTLATPPAAADTSCTIPGLTNGTPYIFSVQASNSAGPGPSAWLSSPATPVASVTVAQDPILLGGTVGQSYSTVITPMGGTGPYQFSIIAGRLPNGLNAELDQDGLSIRIFGVPSQSETANFTLSISDSTATQAAFFSKVGPTLTTIEQAYSITVTAAVVMPVTPTPVPSLSIVGIVLLNLLGGLLAALGLQSRRKPV